MRGYTARALVAAVAIVLAAFLTVAALPATGAQDVSSHSSELPAGTCVLQSGESDGSYPAFPSVLRTSTNRVFATWRLSQEHQDAGGKIMLSELLRPYDGCNWTVPRVIATESAADYNIGPAGFAEAADGSLVIGVSRYHVKNTSSADHFSAHVIRSTDGGTTWGPTLPVNAGYAGDISYPASLAKLADGSLVMALYGNDDPAKPYDGKWYVRLARSTDDGRNWRPWGSGVPMTEGRQWSEPELLVDGSRLVMALRYDVPKGGADTSGAFLVSSDDLGRSWSVPRRITSGTSGSPALAKLHNGLYALAYRDMTQPNYPFRYALSPNLRTWAMNNDVTGGSTRRMLYAGFTALDRNKSLAVFSLENPESNPHGWSSVHSAVIH